MRSALAVPLLLSVPLALSNTAGTAAPREQIIRSQVRVVAVYVRVFDLDDRFVGDLTADDFELYEDDVRQDVRILYRVSEPTGRHGARSIETLETRTEDEAFNGPAPRARQTWIFVFDENHLTPGAGFDRARQAVIDFVTDRFPAGDLGGIVAGGAMVNDRLTSVPEELLAAVMKVKPPTAARVRRLDRIESGRRLWHDEPEGSFRALEARRQKAEAERDRDRSLNTIRALLRELQSIEGPRTIVYLSDGFNFGASAEDFAAGGDSYSTSIFHAATRADTRFYTIDVRGLDFDRGAGDVDRIPIDIGDATVLRPPRVGIFEEDAGASIALLTGGFNVRAQNNLGLVLDRIARDAGNYYVLGYQPARAEPDGRFRRIEVNRCRRHMISAVRPGYARVLTRARDAAIGGRALQTWRSPRRA